MTQNRQPLTKTEYMNRLSHRLRRLPKEDYDRALEYFEEYFADAGPEYEQQAIEDLGAPEEAANTLILEIAKKNTSAPPRGVKRSFSAVWVAILAIFAAPIAIPVAVSLVIVAGALLVSIGAVLICVILSAASIVAAGILSIFTGGFLLFHSFADGLCNLGFGLFLTGAGILFVYGTVLLFRWFIRKSAVLLGKITKGGHRK